MVDTCAVVATTASASWTCDRYSVEKRTWVPRAAAFLTRMGSR